MAQTASFWTMKSIGLTTESCQEKQDEVGSHQALAFPCLWLCDQVHQRPRPANVAVCNLPQAFQLDIHCRLGAQLFRGSKVAQCIWREVRVVACIRVFVDVCLQPKVQAERILYLYSCIRLPSYQTLIDWERSHPYRSDCYIRVHIQHRSSVFHNLAAVEMLQYDKCTDSNRIGQRCAFNSCTVLEMLAW